MKYRGDTQFVLFTKFYWFDYINQGAMVAQVGNDGERKLYIRIDVEA